MRSSVTAALLAVLGLASLIGLARAAVPEAGEPELLGGPNGDPAPIRPSAAQPAPRPIAPKPAPPKPVAPKPAAKPAPIISPPGQHAAVQPPVRGATPRAPEAQTPIDAPPVVAENEPADIADPPEMDAGAERVEGDEVYAERDDNADAFAEIEAQIRAAARVGDLRARQVQALYRELDDIAAERDYFERTGGLGPRERAIIERRMDDLRDYLSRTSDWR